VLGGGVAVLGGWRCCELAPVGFLFKLLAIDNSLKSVSTPCQPRVNPVQRAGWACSSSANDSAKSNIVS
jgi:hypothetical protein